MIKSFGDSIYTGKINIDQIEMDQKNLCKKNLVEFDNRSIARRTEEGKDNNTNTFESAIVLYEGQESIFNAFKSGIFPFKDTPGKGLKILTPK